MWHFKGEKRILKDRHVRDAKELAKFTATWNEKLAAELEERRRCNSLKTQ